MPASTLPPYAAWLTEWEAYLTDSSLVPRVLESVCLVHKPLIPTSWRDLLASYSDQQLVQFFLRGITDGFQVSYNGLRSSRKNLDGAIQYPEVVDEYLAKEMTINRLVDPFFKAQLPGIQISRFGVIPKWASTCANRRPLASQIIQC